MSQFLMDCGSGLQTLDTSVSAMHLYLLLGKCFLMLDYVLQITSHCDQVGPNVTVKIRQTVQLLTKKQKLLNRL